MEGKARYEGVGPRSKDELGTRKQWRVKEREDFQGAGRDDGPSPLMPLTAKRAAKSIKQQAVSSTQKQKMARMASMARGN